MLAPSSSGDKPAAPLTPRRNLVRGLKERFSRRAANSQDEPSTSELPIDEVPAITPRRRRESNGKLSRQASAAMTTELLLNSLPLAEPCTQCQKIHKVENDTPIDLLLIGLPLEAPSTPHQTMNRRGSRGGAVETASRTPRRGSMRRRGSNSSLVDNIKETFARNHRRDSLDATTTPRSKRSTPKKSCQSSSTFNTFIGNMSFGNMSITSLPFGAVKSAPYGKEMLDYAERSTGELSEIDSLDNDIDFDQGTVGVEMAKKLRQRILDEIQQQQSQKEDILKKCAKDWELAQARKESGNRLGFLTTIRKMHIRRMECCKHDQVLHFLGTLKLVVETEITQATCLTELTGAEAALVMPITEVGLQEEIECMLTDWDETIDVDDMNVEEFDDITDFEEELFQELLSTVI
eukprot:scaffold6064_cov173-Amphora_coffeaeformis.AAC.12